MIDYAGQTTVLMSQIVNNMAAYEAVEMECDLGKLVAMATESAYRKAAEEAQLRSTRYSANPSVVSAMRSMQRWCESMATEAQS